MIIGLKLCLEYFSMQIKQTKIPMHGAKSKNMLMLVFFHNYLSFREFKYHKIMLRAVVTKSGFIIFFMQHIHFNFCHIFMFYNYEIIRILLVFNFYVAVLKYMA